MCLIFVEKSIDMNRNLIKLHGCAYTVILSSFLLGYWLIILFGVHSNNRSNINAFAVTYYILCEINYCV